MQEVLLKHYDLHDEKRKQTTTGVLEYAIYLLSTALAQFLSFSFKHIGIYFEIKIQDSNNKGI